ncbi:MAG: oxygenase MpaB family protein [Nocardioidaceae bacterium]|nr:oxygenase MpaB family protein [Nocardioidaceae bacterium]
MAADDEDLLATGLEPRIEMRDYWDGITAMYAGAANVALQMLGAPGVAYGVMESKVESGRIDKHPIKRGRTTLTYLAIAVLGTDRERYLYREAVNTSHRQVRSTAESPVRYNAFDPELQLWVAACLYFGLVDTWEALHGPLDDELAERIYRQSDVLGTTLQMRPEQWPASRREFYDYFDERLETAEVDDVTVDFLRRLYRFDQMPVWFAPAGRFLEFMNVGFTPPALREKLGYTWKRRHQRAFDLITATTGAVNRRLPRFVRNMPFNLYLWDVRRRMRAGQPLV